MSSDYHDVPFCNRRALGNQSSPAPTHVSQVSEDSPNLDEVMIAQRYPLLVMAVVLFACKLHKQKHRTQQLFLQCTALARQC